MPKIIGKTVYVLGAGTSFHAGIPLLQNFLVNARMIYESNPKLVYKDSFEKVFKWIDKLRGSSYYIDFDLDNLEHIFSLADMGKQIGREECKNIFDDLSYLVMETIDQCTEMKFDQRLAADPIYSTFVKSIETNRDRRIKALSPGSANFKQDVIVSFNYDCLLDFVFALNQTLSCDYFLDKTKPPTYSAYPLLKLHGSAHWGYCEKDECRKKIIPLDLQGIFQSSFSFEPSNRKMLVVTEALKQRKCKTCKGEMTPKIIPPTWSKTVGGSDITPVWEKAVDEIKDAFQIVVIGYSMPQTDTFFQYLLTLGLYENPNLHRVVVVNPDSSPDFKGRYEKVFSRSLKDRNRLQFISGENGKYEKFVYSGMDGINEI